MADIFSEVDEQLRSQRYQDLMRRGWPFLAAAAVAALIVTLGVWGWTKHQAHESDVASVAYQAGLDAVGKGDAAAAEGSFAGVAASAPPAYRALALMQEAQIRLDQKQVDEAVRLFDQAAKTAPDAIIGDAARLKAAYVLMDAHPLAEVEARLVPLTGAKAPYRSLAREALAMARLQGGKLEQARGDFAVLTLSQDVSQAAQARAHAAIDLIRSGSAAGLAAAIKAAAAAPLAAPGPSAAPSAVQAAPSSAPQAGAAQ